MSETTYTSHTWQEGELITAELMNHLEQGIANISASSGSSQTVDPELNNRVEALETSNADAIERIEALEDFKPSIIERIDSDETVFANYVNSFEPSITNRVSSLETSNTTITNRIGRLENSNTNISGRVDSLETSNTAIVDRMDQQELLVHTLDFNLQEMSTVFTSEIIYSDDIYEPIIDIETAASSVSVYKLGNLGILQYDLEVSGETPGDIEIAHLQNGFIANGYDYYEMSGCPLSIRYDTIYLKAGTYSSANNIRGQLIYIIDQDSTNESQGEDSNA